MGYRDIKGKKCDSIKSPIEVLPIIRKYVKQKYPNVKFSLVNQRGGMTYRFDFKFTQLPFNPYTPEFLAWGQRTNWGQLNYKTDTFEGKRYNQKYIDMEEDIKRFVNQYNYDYSDPMTDYYDVRFYFFIDIDYKYAEQLGKGILKKVNKKDLELIQFKKDANRLTKNNTKSYEFLYVDTSKGRRYYSGSGYPIKKGLIEFMDKNNYKYTIFKKIY